MKKLLKIFIITVLSISIFLNFNCYAEDVNIESDEPVVTLSTDDSETENDETSAEETSDDEDTDEETSDDEESDSETEDEIYYGDLYLFGTDITMDKLVDGNVFIFGTNVEVTGQVNGNLIILANSVSFNESYVSYDIFVAANSIYYNGACYDLYSASNSLEMTYDSYVIRDVKSVSSTTVLKAAVGRDVDLITNTIDVGSGEDIPVIYGNFRYSANSEIEIPEGVISDGYSATYTPITSSSSSNYSLSSIIIGICTLVLTILVIALIVRNYVPKLNDKINSFDFKLLHLLKYLGIGLAALIGSFIVIILLLTAEIGAKLAILLALLLGIILIISVPIFAICITNIIKSICNINYYLLLILVAIVLYGINIIPYAGSIIFFIIKCIILGFLLSKNNKVNLNETENITDNNPDSDTNNDVTVSND